jgi:hypothetical protein
VTAAGGVAPLIIDLVDPVPAHHHSGDPTAAPRVGVMSYEELLAGGDQVRRGGRRGHSLLSATR